MNRPEMPAIPTIHLAGPVPAEARTGLVLLHGRGSNAADMTTLARAVATDTTCVLAPEAPGTTWYPNRFLAPRSLNEPWLSRALDAVETAVGTLVEAGIPKNRVFVGGFSQGACLAAEYVASRPARYGGLAAFAGALVSPDPLRGGYAGDLAGTPVLLAVGALDQHVPPEYVTASANVLAAMGATVELLVRPEMGHSVHPRDVESLRALIAAV